MEKKLSQEILRELQKEFMSKSVQLEYSGSDTDGSTKGSMSIKSHNQFLDAFPQIIPIHDKYKQSPFSQNTEKKKKRRLSLTAIPVLEENEQEFQEKGEDESHQLPHLNLMKDHQEFSDRIDQLFVSNKEFRVQTKLRTYSVDKLEQVMEVDEQEEKQNKNKKQIYNLDQNEFNCSTPTISRRISKKVSQNLGQNEENIIQEDFESEKNMAEPKRKSWFSNEASPRYKMVDELEKKTFSFPPEKPEIVPIQEEKESAEPTQAEKIFESSIGKLHKESEYINNIVQIEQFKDESMKESKAESMGLIKEIDGQFEDDCNNNNKKNILQQIKVVEENPINE